MDAIALSHCHHDHVSSLADRATLFSKAHVLMTELSYFLVERVLHNSVNVHDAPARANWAFPMTPLFSHDEIDDTAHLFQGFRYNREIEWAAL